MNTGHSPPSFVNGVNAFKDCLEELSKSIKFLSLQTPAADALECRQFLREQLVNIVNGNYTSIDHLNPLPKDFARSEGMNSMSHLGMISAKRIQCDYSEVFVDDFKSLLELHTDEDSWCKNCINEHGKKTDLPNGKINAYSCWRRSQSSGQLGFLLQASVYFANNQVGMRVNKIDCSKGLVAQNIGSQKLRFASVATEQVAPGTSMICTLLVDMKQDRSTDELLEIQGILGQQLLHSKNLKFNSSEGNRNYRLRNEKVPSFISRIIKDSHNKWHLSGPSRDSIGVLEVLLVNNQNPFVETSAFTTPIRNLCSKEGIRFEMHQLPDLNSFSKQHLCLNEQTLPQGTYAFVLLLDSLVDFGGVVFE